MDRFVLVQVKVLFGIPHRAKNTYARTPKLYISNPTKQQTQRCRLSGPSSHWCPVVQLIRSDQQLQSLQTLEALLIESPQTQFKFMSKLKSALTGTTDALINEAHALSRA